MTPSPASPTAPRKRRFWRWLLLAVGLLVLFPIGVIYSLNWYGERRFQAELDKIRARGEPVDAKGLDAIRSVPKLDLTDLYRGASVGLGNRAGLVDDLDDLDVVPIAGYMNEAPLPGEPWDKIEMTERCLHRARGQLAMLHDAELRDGGAFFPYKFQDGIGVDFSSSYELRTAVKWLVLDAHFQAYRSRPADAARSLRTAIHVCNLMLKVPASMLLHMRYGNMEFVIYFLNQLLPAVEWHDTDLRSLQTRLRESIDTNELHNALIGDRVMMIESLQRPEFFDGRADSLLQKALDKIGVKTDGKDETDASHLLWAYEQHRNFSTYCELMRRAISVARSPWALAHAESKAIEQEVSRQGWQAEDKTTMGAIEWFYDPNLLGTLTDFTRSIASSRLADAAIGAELYRRKHGKLPERVEQLVPEFLPEVPLDPFDGQPIRYVVREDKYVFYSVGPDGQDDGAPGPDPDDVDGNGPDIEFAVKRKAE